MLSFLTAPKEPNQENLKVQIKKSLMKVCPHCNNYSVEELTFGEEVHPCSQCKPCSADVHQMLATNLVTVPVFTDNLARELHQYGANKLRPVNSEKANSETCADISKKLGEQIKGTEETIKKFKQVTTTKLSELVGASEAANKVAVFERVAELQQTKKLEQIGNGELLIKSSLVTDSLHFVDQQGLDESNNRLNEHFNQVNDLTDVNLNDLNELINYIKKVQV